MNYLVLTPDGVGSNYLQRTLTVYLNSSGIEYYNTHELLNGLVLDDNNNLYKKMMGYGQSIEEIIELIEKNEGNIISRLAQYAIEARLAGKKGFVPKWEGLPAPALKILKRNMYEDYTTFYDVCRNNYNKIFYCTRDPFEYALSWSIRDISGKLNVYSIKERIETHGKDITYDVNLDFMTSKLDQYKRYIYWVKDNFKDAVEIKYDDLHTDVDLILFGITGLDYRMLDTWGISLQDYSTLLYKISMIYNPALDYSDRLVEYQKILVQQKKLYRFGIPIKKTTLSDKSNKVINFVSCLETYNKWAIDTNEYSQLSESELFDRIEKESQIYL